MNRRAFVTGLGAVLVAPLAAEAQRAGKVWRIGLIGEGARRTDPTSGLSGFITGLRELGYVEGRNLIIEYRYADTQTDRLPGFVVELVRSNVDLIATHGTRETLLVKSATSTIPVVMLWVGDPVQAGIVRSLNDPGGNITGNSLMSPESDGKRLELLREIVPKLRRVAILWNPKNASTARSMEAVADTARALRLTVVSIEADSASRLEVALAEMPRQRPDGVLVIQDALLLARRRDIAVSALRHRVATGLPGRAYVETGGLFGYGPDVRAVGLRGAMYVDKIFKGAKPADLPIEQPTKFELIINLKTAQALGLTIPPSVLLRADQVLE